VTSPEEVRDAVADAHRREWGFVLAATARVAGSIDVAEECVQDAYGAALDAWLRDGVPSSPGAWLTTTARRRALDVLRRDQTLRRKLPLLVEPVDTEPAPGEDEPESIPDDRLRLVFTCCHPALSREAQVALTLRLVCGLSTDEIARGFLVPEATMAARVTRAKKKIAAARIPYRVPEQADLPERLDAVLTVVHLVFTTGHLAPTGDDLVRPDLVERAVDLARVLRILMPDEREVAGLLALMLLTDARRVTRTGPDGGLVLLEDQDRTRWDPAKLTEGITLARESAHGRPGRFVLQAAVAAEHGRARTYDETDWQRILDLYDAMLTVWPNPVVALNRVVAVLMVHGAEAALADLAVVEEDPRMAGYRYLAATRADLLRRLDRREEAAAAYREAIVAADNAAERAFLTGRLAEVSPPTAGRDARPSAAATSERR
jgi:RNA polymerase sigma-70 factor, ECF subfamily